MEFTAKDLSNATRIYREKLLDDPYRPGYHFAVPDNSGNPGDPNGAFFADGTYHLMYLYYHLEKEKFHWGHISSRDLLHWRHHPDCLESDNGDKGCFSGGAFVDDDGTAYLTFWKFSGGEGEESGGIAIAYSRPPYDKWERIRPIAVKSAPIWGTADIEVDGEIKHISCADPSNIWKMGDTYYMQTGNLVVLNNYGRAEDSPEEYKGDRTDLFKSKDLKAWEFVHRFYENPHLDEDYPDATEDDMCPSFLRLPDSKADGKLTDKWLQLFIAHNKGAQYYVGSLRDEHFYPEDHGRFSWKDNTCFAPEALIDDRNRHIAWYWLLDDRECGIERFGWSGVFSFPRVLWLEDGILRMAPAEELDRLQYNGQTFGIGAVDSSAKLDVKNGELLRIKATIDPKASTKAGFSVRATSDGKEHTDIYVDMENGKLVFDATESGCEGRRIKEEAPFELKSGEMIELDIFIDKSVVEVYANERQAISRRVYPTNPAEAVIVKAISDGADFRAVQAFEMHPTNPY